MPNEFLSQDEVDALLQGAAGDDEALAEAAPEDGVRPYDLAAQDRVVSERMPTLEIINERFARLLRIGLFNFMRRSPEISAGPVRVMPYSDFIDALTVPTNLNLVQMKPLRGNALFIFDPDLVFLVIDTLFGGDGRFPAQADGRDFTPTEQRIIQRMLGVVFDDYQKSWAPVFPMTFQHLRSEMQPRFAVIAGAAEAVVCTTFRIQVGSAGGDLHMCMPYASLEPIRDLLCRSAQGDQAEPDKRWQQLLGKQVQAAEVDMVVNLSEVPVTCKQILNMQVGDVIMLDIQPSVIAQVDGVPVFRCRYGNSRGQYAVRIEETIAASNPDR